MTILITGPGRSGTTLLASVYRELGFDPGGSFSKDNKAGYEAPDVVAMNQRLVAEMGVTPFGPPRVYRNLAGMIGERGAEQVKARLPRSARLRIRRGFDKLPGRSASRLEFIPHDRVSSIASTHRTHLRELADSREVLKDPLFGWTLPVWLAAGVNISSVIISTRKISASVASHESAGHLRFRSKSDAKNSLIYALGLLIASCEDNDVPYRLVRFPDFTADPASLHKDLAFPSQVDLATFQQAYDAVVDRAYIHRYED